MHYQVNKMNQDEWDDFVIQKMKIMPFYVVSVFLFLIGLFHFLSWA